MNGFVSMVQSVAWPLAVLGLALMFRPELKGMCARVGRVKYRDVEVTFHDDLRQAEALAKAVPTPGRAGLEVDSGESAPILGGEILGGLGLGPDRPAAPRPDGLDQLASRSPREAVLEGWSTVGQALLKAAATLGDRRAPAPLRAEDAARFLIGRGWLTGPEAQLVERLRGLRDRVAHHEEAAPSADEARRFVALAGPLAARVATLGAVA